jgi:hypothetical protein
VRCDRPLRFPEPHRTYWRRIAGGAGPVGAGRSARLLPFELCFVARRAAAVVIDLSRNDDTRIASKSYLQVTELEDRRVPAE